MNTQAKCRGRPVSTVLQCGTALQQRGGRFNAPGPFCPSHVPNATRESNLLPVFTQFPGALRRFLVEFSRVSLRLYFRMVCSFARSASVIPSSGGTKRCITLLESRPRLCRRREEGLVSSALLIAAATVGIFLVREKSLVGPERGKGLGVARGPGGSFGRRIGGIDLKQTAPCDAAY
jgi:hypothetical protein